MRINGGYFVASVDVVLKLAMPRRLNYPADLEIDTFRSAGKAGQT